MRLKHLTLQGFKTFASKTEFAFDGDITAIIGPNGSGKSNVADALRWVLGEQSYTQLRARRSEDLIFAGSSARGQQGMAEVTLVLDNADRTLPIAYDDVSITRRAFRSGENEYYINRSRVRLRDMQELLAPIGQSFTAVGQGLADELLSLRPEERRALFEEAAGIRPFYAQRDDALRRLGRTEENMVRVGDLVAELEPQLKHLDRQARHAQEYNTVADELRALLDGWYGAQWRAARAAGRAAEAQEQTAAAALAGVRAAADEADRQAQEGRHAATATRAAVDRLAGEQGALLQQAAEANRAAAVHAERLAALEQQQQQTFLEHESGREALAQATAQLAELLAAQQGTEQAEGELRHQVSGAERAQQRTAEARRVVDRALTVAQERAAESAAHAAGLRQRLAGSQDHRRDLERQLAEQQEAAGRLVERQAAEQAEATRAEASLRAAETAQATAQDALGRAERAVATAQQARDQAEKERRAAAAEAESLHTRLDLARNLSEGGAGLPHAVRAVLQAPGLPGIRGVVATLIGVPAALETAVEIALGGRINDVVVATWPDAEAAIAWLQRARAGRATFLPLDSLRPPDLGGDPLRFLDGRQGVRGLGAALVSAAPEYRAVVDYLLGRTLVVDDLPVARRVLARTPGGWNIVTVGGEIVRSGGAVTGGSAGREQGLLARERERRELGSALEQAQATLAARAAAALAAAGQLTHAEAARQAAAEASTAARRLVGERREATGHLVQRQAQSTQEHAWRLGLVAQAETALRDWGLRLEGFAAELQQIEQEAGPLAARIAELLTAAQQARQAEGQRVRAERLHSLAAELAQAAAGLDAAQAQATGWEQAAAELRGRLAVAQGALDGAQDRQTALEETQRRAQAAILAQESAHGHSAVERERREGALRQLRTRIEEDLGLAPVGDPPADTPAAGGTGDFCDPQAVVRTWEAWVARAEAPHPSESAPPDGNSTSENPRIAQLRARLRRMGPINPLAIDEHAAAQARYGFLTGQLSDLRTAAESLRQVAAELDRLMRERLAATFQAVAAAFQETFPRLFGGGSARLELTDPADVTATGIEVLAQPPGKRIQPLSALSGGERALASVALLFAILKVRPTPFCIMDEVDAALDEANIGRFSAELRALSARSQFILITHNRTTIEVAAAIYGVSLGQDTASRVLGLRLEQVPRAA